MNIGGEPAVLAQGVPGKNVGDEECYHIGVFNTTLEGVNTSR